MMYEPHDTFDALRRSPIEVVDEELLTIFNMPYPFNPILRNTYVIVLESEQDRELLRHVLSSHFWTLENYIAKTCIGWEGI